MTSKTPSSGPPNFPAQPGLTDLWTRAAELVRRRQSIDETLRHGPTGSGLFAPAEEGRALLAERDRGQRELEQVQAEIKERAARQRT